MICGFHSDLRCIKNFLFYVLDCWSPTLRFQPSLSPLQLPNASLFPSFAIVLLQLSITRRYFGLITLRGSSRFFLVYFLLLYSLSIRRSFQGRLRAQLQLLTFLHSSFRLPSSTTAASSWVAFERTCSFFFSADIIPSGSALSVTAASPFPFGRPPSSGPLRCSFFFPSLLSCL